MKTLLLSVLAMSAGLSVFAQRIAPGATRPAPSLVRGHTYVTDKNAPYGAAKSTSVITSDTMLLYNNYDSLLFQSSALYSYGVLSPADSGYVFGTNAYGDKGFAEYFYDYFLPDTSIEVVGVYSAWGGTVNPASTNSVTFSVWTVDTTTHLDFSNIYLTDLPGTIIGSSQPVPFTALNLGTPGAATLTYFSTPIPNIQSDFFLGYTVNYTFGAGNDTIGLRSTPNGDGAGSGFYYTDNNGDTVVYSQNAVYTSAGQWLDGYVDLGEAVNLSLLPIFFIDPTTSVKGVTKNSLTIFGCAPNPAINSTNINYGLQQPADVSIEVVDATGRTMTTIKQPAQAVGTHTVNVQTGTWPAGNYVCVARTSTGASIASQLTIIK